MVTLLNKVLKTQDTQTANHIGYDQPCNSDVSKIIKMQSLARAFLTMRRLANKVRKHAKRTRVMLEMLDVERDYVQSLDAICKVFYKPATMQHLLNEDEASILFANIPKILAVHKEILQKMTEKFESWNYSSGISDFFECLFLNVGEYGIFIENFPQASELLREKEREDKFHKFLEKAHSSPECKGRDLISLLIEPVQRLPRYELLLKEYLKLMEDTHPNFRATQRVLTTLERSLRKINDANKTSTKIEHIRKTVEGGGSVEYYDYIIESQFLERQKWNCEIYAFLFSNVIIYAKFNSPNILAKLFSAKMYQFHLSSAIYIRDVKNICVVDKEGFENSFALKTKQGVFIMQAKTKRQRDQWFDEISSLVNSLQDLQEKSQPATE